MSLQINELDYDAAVKYFATLPADCAEYIAARQLMRGHDMWKRATMDLIERAEKMNAKLDEIHTPLKEIGQKV